MVQPEQLIVVTTDNVPGRSVQAILGPVWGVALISYERKAGEFPEYTAGIFGRQRPTGRTRQGTRPYNPSDTAAAIDEAMAEMQQAAANAGANAIVGVRLDSIITGAQYPIGGGNAGALLSPIPDSEDRSWSRREWGLHQVHYTAYGTAVVLD